MRRQSASETRYTISVKKNELFMKWIGGIAGAGVTRAVFSSQARQWRVASRAVRADVAMASTMEAPSMQVHRDDGVWAWAIAHIGASVDLGFGLNNAVNSISPNIRGVRT